MLTKAWAGAEVSFLRELGGEGQHLQGTRVCEVIRGLGQMAVLG